MANFLALLDTMWGAEGKAPMWFHINPHNRSGARLYQLTGARRGELLVGNVCSVIVRHASIHGTPDTEWLRRTLLNIPPRFDGALLLVCGVQAKRTYERLATQYRGPVLFLDHPAARRWTQDRIAMTQRLIRRHA